MRKASAKRKPGGASRSYDNSLRERRAEETRERILEAAAERIASDPTADLTFGRIARSARVSEPTVYRYFQNRAALAEAVEEWLADKLEPPRIPDALEELPAAALAMFQYFDRSAPCVRAANNQPGRPFQRLGQRERNQKVQELLRPVTDGRSEEEAKAIFALLRYLVSSRAWQSLSDGFGISGAESGPVVAWAAQTLIAELAKGEPIFPRGAEERGEESS